MPIHHNLLGQVPADTDRIRNYLANEDLAPNTILLTKTS